MLVDQENHDSAPPQPPAQPVPAQDSRKWEEAPVLGMRRRVRSVHQPHTEKKHTHTIPIVWLDLTNGDHYRGITP